MFYDFHVHGNGKLAKEAKRLGYHAICLVFHSNNYNQEILEIYRKVKKNGSVNSEYPSISIGVEILSKTTEDLKKNIKEIRKIADVLIVHGGNIKINRAACRDPRVDIIAHPYKNRTDCGINHVLAREAAKNEVAIEINMNNLLKSKLSIRSRVLSQYRQITKLQRKFKFPIIITTGAHSIYDLRTPKDIIVLSGSFGMAEKDAFDALYVTPRNIIERSKIREDVIVNGAKIIR